MPMYTFGGDMNARSVVPGKGHQAPHSECLAGSPQQFRQAGAQVMVRAQTEAQRS